MKNVFLKTKYSVLLFCLFGLLLTGFITSCDGCVQPPPPPPPPNLVIIGEDLSGTYDKFPATTTEDLTNLCNLIAKMAAGGELCFMGIGNQTPKGYANCKIKPLKYVDPSSTVSEQSRVRKWNERIKDQNKKSISDFIEKSSEILEQKNQAHTDINGFFKKVNSILDSPSNSNCIKWLYVNSDGKQDVAGSNKVDCALMPKETRIFLNRGWEKKPDCDPEAKILDTPAFIQILEDEIKNTTISNQ